MIKRILIIVLVIISTLLFFNFINNSMSFKNEQMLFEYLTDGNDEQNYVTCEYDDKHNMMMIYQATKFDEVNAITVNEVFYDKETFEPVEIYFNQNKDIMTNELSIINKMITQNLKIDLTNKEIKNYDINVFNDCLSKIDLSIYQPYIKKYND